MAVIDPRNVVYVTDYGAVGDGLNSSATANTAALLAARDDAFGTRANPKLARDIRPLCFPAGDFRIDTAGIDIESVNGWTIYGHGRFVTRIENLSSTGDIFKFNGASFGTMSEMLLVCNMSGTGTCIDLDWDHIGTVNLQSNMFSNLRTAGGNYGVEIARTATIHGSENQFINCFVGEHEEAGYKVYNYNALQNTILGGNIAQTKIGVHVVRGSFSNIVGCGFQLTSEWDIKVDTGVSDCLHVDGVRTESRNFVRSTFKVVKLTACSQKHAELGSFLECDRGFFHIDTCQTVAGRVISHWMGGSITSSCFGRDDFLSAPNPNCRINLSKVQYGDTSAGEGGGTGPYMMERGYFVPSGLTNA
jgi:hypothetical protein